MRLRITHETAYRYGQPATRAIETLKLTPRSCDGQFVVNWRIDVDRDCRLEAATDPFGNVTHSFTAEGPIEALTVTAEGEVETQDQQGIVTGQVELFPPLVFLRDTALTASDAALRDFAETLEREAGPDRLNLMHSLMRRLHERMAAGEEPADAGVGAVRAFAAGGAAARDIAHVFIAAARHLGVPARYISGYLHRPEVAATAACHGWAEALVPNIGWIGFDAVHNICPTDAYVRVAVGLDFLGAAPLRGARYGGGSESVAVRVVVREVAARAAR
jgi:transglutaminase-like putative cysteine protease